MKKRISLFITALFCSAMAHTVAAEETWYEIELIVFAHNNASALDDELWPKDILLSPKGNSVNIDRQGVHYSSVSRDNYVLKDEAYRIKNNSKYRLLTHTRWLQPVIEGKRSKPVYLRTGNMLDDGSYELEGYITVDRGRYLHFRPDIYFSRSLSAYEAGLLRQPSNRAAENTASTRSDQTVVSQSFGTAVDSLNSVSTGTEQAPVFGSLQQVLTVNIDQPRRMRSDELHYIDHPMFGILVKIDRAPVPQS